MTSTLFNLHKTHFNFHVLVIFTSIVEICTFFYVTKEHTVFCFFDKLYKIHFVLCVIGKQDAVDATLETLNVISEPLKSMARMMVDVCAYAGSVHELVYITMCACNSQEDVLLKSVKISMKFEITYLHKFCRDWQCIKSATFITRVFRA